jgi:hypothetical protein
MPARRHYRRFGEDRERGTLTEEGAARHPRERHEVRRPRGSRRTLPPRFSTLTASDPVPRYFAVSLTTCSATARHGSASYTVAPRHIEQAALANRARRLTPPDPLPRRRVTGPDAWPLGSRVAAHMASSVLMPCDLVISDAPYHLAVRSARRRCGADGDAHGVTRTLAAPIHHSPSAAQLVPPSARMQVEAADTPERHVSRGWA